MYGMVCVEKYQSGFRKYHITETELLKALKRWMLAANSGHTSILVLLDLSAVLTIDHETLFDHLKIWYQCISIGLGHI